MSHSNLLREVALTAGMLTLATSLTIAQGAQSWRERTVVPIASGEWTGARLADGQPDVQGHWSNTIGNHNNFSRPQGGDDGAPGGGARERSQANRAPSRVSDPPDGQIPYQDWARAKAQEFGAHLDDPTRPEYVEPLARCAPAGPTESRAAAMTARDGGNAGNARSNCQRSPRPSLRDQNAEWLIGEV